MILQISVNFKEIIEKEKKYPWVRPKRCKKCGYKRLWGHGYVRRYFEWYEGLVWIKRYRCPCCSTVYTMRPKGNWRRFQASVETIVRSIREKLVRNKWLKGIYYQRQQYWLSGFKKQIVRLGYSLEQISLEVFEEMIKAREIAVTHSMKFFKVYSV